MLDEAIAHFEEALAVDTRTGARPAVVHDRVGLAGALLERAGPADPPRARDLLRQAMDEGTSARACRDRSGTAAALAERLAGRSGPPIR